MTVHSTSILAPRAPRFSEILSSPLEKQHKVEDRQASTEAKQMNTEMAQASDGIRNMSLRTPTQTTSGQRQDEMVAQPSEKAKSPVCGTSSHATAGSSKAPQGKRQPNARSKLPSLVSTMTGDDLDIAFGSLPLRPEMRPICSNRKRRKCAHVPKDELDEGHIYFCLDCNDRPICRACIANMLVNTEDPHTGEHYLRPWKPKMSVQFEKFLWERRHGARLQFGPKEMLGREWLYSDYSFAPSSIGNLTVRFSINAEPGTYRLSVCLRTYVSSSAISKDTLGKNKHSVIQDGTARIGSLGVGVHTVDRDAPAPSKGVNASLSRLPEKVVQVKITEGTQNEEEISLPETVQVLEDQALEVSIRHWHDKSVFTKRSPFKWWLESITLIPEIEKEQIAAKESTDASVEEQSG